MEKQELQQLFNLYLAQKASPAEVKLLLRCFRMENESGLKEMILREIELSPADSTIIPIHEGAVYKRVKDVLDQRIDCEEKPASPPVWKTSVFRVAISVAATLILASGIYLWTRSLPAEIKTVYAAYGKRLEVHLPDSSRVWLNAGTTLRYPVRFPQGKRSVTLQDGVAYFEVAHDVHSSFIVTANEVAVNVLGTSFEVTALNKETGTKVTVSNGKVGVLPDAGRQKAIFLLPGERADVDRATHQVQLSKVDTADIAAWRYGRLIFENQPIAEVMRSLERTYNVHITITNERLKQEKVTMRLNHQPLDNVLSALSFSNHFSYLKINEQSVIVK